MPNLGMVGTLACWRAQTMGCCCGDRRSGGRRGGGWQCALVCGWQTKSKAASNVIMELLCLFDTPSICFPTDSLPPSLFLFAAQYLSTFHPLFSLSLFTFYLLSLSLSLCLLFSSFLSLSVSLRKRLQHCRGGCTAGAEEIFLFFISVIVRASPSPWIHTHICTHTYTDQMSHTRQTLTTNSQGLAQN